MKVIELERAIQEQSNKITKSQIIPKAKHIAEKLGKGGRTNESWCNANYVFSDDLISIDYYVCMMGDEQINVALGKNKVFEAIERVNERPKYPNPVIDVDGRKFEIAVYNPGDWEQRIMTLYRKMTTDVPEKDLLDAQKRLGISNSK